MSRIAQQEATMAPSLIKAGKAGKGQGNHPDKEALRQAIRIPGINKAFPKRKVP
jgi:hypothetical protein